MTFEWSEPTGVLLDKCKHDGEVVEHKHFMTSSATNVIHAALQRQEPVFVQDPLDQLSLVQVWAPLSVTGAAGHTEDGNRGLMSHEINRYRPSEAINRQNTQDWQNLMFQLS